jgi:acyl-CoA thioester hydrolase
VFSVNTNPQAETWLAHRVSYGETDAMNVVYYAEYFHLFERVRNEYIRERGMTYKDVEARGIYLPVREADARYRFPLRYDDLIHIRGMITEWRRASVLFEYEIYNEDKSAIATLGRTLHACINSEGKPVPIPAWLRDLFE